MQLTGQPFVGVPSPAAAGGRAVLGPVESTGFAASPELHEEVFGAASFVVRCRSTAEMPRLEGKLAATVQAKPDRPNNFFPCSNVRPVESCSAAGRPKFRSVTAWRMTAFTVHFRQSCRLGENPCHRTVSRPVAHQDVPAELLPGVFRDESAEPAQRRVTK